MANLTIHQPEILFLQDAVIRKYCELTRVDPLQFRRGLTGTMKHYMDIAENILDHLDNEHLRAYTASIGDGPIRTALRKLLEDEARGGRGKDSHWRPIVTDNVVRKLLFTDAGQQPELTFKDFFVVAFYVYVGADRTDVLQRVAGHMGPSAQSLHPVVGLAALGRTLRDLGAQVDIGAGVEAALEAISSTSRAVA